jgi:hypothetical protein
MHGDACRHGVQPACMPHSFFASSFVFIHGSLKPSTFLPKPKESPSSPRCTLPATAHACF